MIGQQHLIWHHNKTGIIYIRTVILDEYWRHSEGDSNQKNQNKSQLTNLNWENYSNQLINRVNVLYIIVNKKLKKKGEDAIAINRHENSTSFTEKEFIKFI